MSPSGPALVGVVKRDWSSLSSIAISWTEVEQPPADIVDYEVKYYEKVLTLLLRLFFIQCYCIIL